ncbi:MAG TPA: hypothetical protein VM260_09030 [Pirellula sp.]|nr:hypothetical protein [Pirellula sp.]
MKILLPFAILGTAIMNFASSNPIQAADMETRNGQPAWVIQSDQMELAVTELGGHMAPVTFYRKDPAPVQPYHISPWQGETHNYPVPVLVPLRGDFFCLPFGGNVDAYRNEKHPPHGETAGSAWKLAGMEKNGAVTTLILEMKTIARIGKVTKKLQLVDGHNVVYSSHRIEGFDGRTPFGHHATLAMPDKEGAFKISHSPIRIGRTNPTQFSDPANGEYQQLGIDQRFTSLTAVPSTFKGAPDVDVSRLPQKKGYADLLMIAPADTGDKPAWLTAVRADEGWLWFSMKDPKVLTSTVFWLENRGRHQMPWLGRNNCVGLEDVTAFFADGLKASAEDNSLNRAGVQTALDMKGDFTVRYIQGVAKIPKGFADVANVQFAEGSVVFVSTSGNRVAFPISHEYLKTGNLPPASGK